MSPSRPGPLILRLEDLKLWDEPEMSEIDGQDRESKFQRRGANQQVAEGDGHAMGLLLAVDLSSKQGSRFRIRIYRQIAEQLIDEGLAAKPNCRGLRSIGSMDKFRESDRRERGILVADLCDYLLDQVLDCIPSALGGDKDAGVKYQSHEIRPMGLGAARDGS